MSSKSSSLEKVVDAIAALLKEFPMPPTRPIFLVFLALALFLLAVQILKRKRIYVFPLLKMKTTYESFLICTLVVGFYFSLISIGLTITELSNVSMSIYVLEIISWIVNGIAFCILIFPFRIFCWRARKNFFSSLYEIAIGKYSKHHIPFSLVILADIFTSYSRFISEFVGLFHFNSKPLWICFFPALPLIFRVRQCLQDFYGSGVIRHLVNTLKYILGITTTVIFEYYNFNKADSLQNYSKTLCVILICASTFLSLFWDLMMDWNMSPWGFRSYSPPVSTPTTSTASLSTDTEAILDSSDSTEDEEAGIIKKDIGKMGRFSKYFYSFAIIYDIFGRCINIVKVLCFFNSCSSLRPLFGKDIGFIYAIIEAFRRFIWTIIRIENYHSQLLYLEANK